jgi:hypothetical protein
MRLKISILVVIPCIVASVTCEPITQLSFPCDACAEAIAYWQQFNGSVTQNMSTNNLKTVCRRLIRRNAQTRLWREDSIPNTKPQTCLEYANGECLAKVASDPAVSRNIPEPYDDCDDEVNPFCTYFRRSNVSAGLGKITDGSTINGGPAVMPNRHVRS